MNFSLLLQCTDLQILKTTNVGLNMSPSKFVNIKDVISNLLHNIDEKSYYNFFTFSSGYCLVEA